MPHYQYPDNKLHFLDDEAFEHILPPGCIQITDEEAAALRNASITPEQLREQAKAARADAVSRITVTTQAGNTFDGDELSQGRMARAILALQIANAPSVNWVLADNTVIQATVSELGEALALAGAAQAAIWVIE